MPAAHTRHALAGVLAALGASAASAQTVLYVNGALATGAGTGASWADACRGPAALQNALDAAAPIMAAGQTAQLWVAAGTYLPSRQSSPGQAGSETFVLLSREELYGGFIGNETSLEERDPAANVTVLSGTLDASHRAWHVVTAPAVDATCIIDGLQIRDGYGFLGDPSTLSGGGLFAPGASPTIRRCTFANNAADTSGGAAYFGDGSPVIETSTFSGNSCDGRGGAVYASGITLLRCTFSDNVADADAMGGAVSVSGSVAAESCVFTGNLSTGGHALSGSAVTLTNCEFISNRSYEGAAALGGSIVATSCVFTDNHAEDVGGGVFEGGNALFTACVFTGNDGASLAGSAPSIGNGGTFDACRFVSQDGEIRLDSAVNCLFSVSGGIRGGSLVNCTVMSGSAGAALMANGAGTLAASNCIFWGIAVAPGAGHTVLNRCDVQSLDPALAGVGNFSADPRLDAAGRLLSPSPCIDAGDGSALPPGTTLDAFGQPRFVDDPGMPNTGLGSPPVDIGAFEFQGVTCYANCDGSTAAPVLNAADFACFLAAFAAGSPYANCDASATPPTLNVQDFTCFLHRFAAGCP